MRKRLTSGTIAAVVAFGMSIPAIGLADRGGHPNHHSKPCKTHRHYGKHKGHGPRNTKGKKCGIRPGGFGQTGQSGKHGHHGQTGQTGATGGTGQTGQSGQTGTTS